MPDRLDQQALAGLAGHDRRARVAAREQARARVEPQAAADLLGAVALGRTSRPAPAGPRARRRPRPRSPSARPRSAPGKGEPLLRAFVAGHLAARRRAQLSDDQ